MKRLSLGFILLLPGCYATNPSLTGVPYAPTTPMPIPSPPVPKSVPQADAPSVAPPTPVPPAHPRQFPARGKVAAVVFEDNFPAPGDADYNDFLTDFRIQQTINSDNQITHITLEFFPRAVGAWYDHEFLLLLSGIKEGATNLHFKSPPMFNGRAKVTLTHLDDQGKVIDTHDNLDPNRDLVVFASTHDLFGVKSRHDMVNTVVGTHGPNILDAHESARVDIAIEDPAANPVEADGEIDIAKYRMVLHVKDTDKFIDIIDVDPNNFFVDPKTGQSFPFGFIIQADWQWPREGVSILKAYPDFARYQQYLVNRAKDPTTKLETTTRDWFMQPPVDSAVFPKIPVRLPEVPKPE